MELDWALLFGLVWSGSLLGLSPEPCIRGDPGGNFSITTTENSVIWTYVNHLGIPKGVAKYDANSSHLEIPAFGPRSSCCYSNLFKFNDIQMCKKYVLSFNPCVRIMSNFKSELECGSVTLSSQVFLLPCTLSECITNVTTGKTVWQNNFWRGQIYFAQQVCLLSCRTWSWRISWSSHMLSIFLIDRV